MTEETPSVFDRKRLSFRRQPSANPADLSTPLELGTLLLRDLAGCQRRGFPNSGEQLAEQGEPDLAPPLLDLGDIFQGIGRESVDGLAELGPVPLRDAFEGVNPVVHHRELPARGIAAAGRLVQQAATGAHERRLADRVLRDAPRGVRAVLADELFAGPPDLQYDLAQAGGVLAVYRLHSRVVALEQRALGGELRAHRLIARVHAQELVPKGRIHRA